VCGLDMGGPWSHERTNPAMAIPGQLMGPGPSLQQNSTRWITNCQIHNFCHEFEKTDKWKGYG